MTYKKMLEEKKRESNDKWRDKVTIKREVQNIRTEDQVWEVVSGERREKRRVNEGKNEIGILKICWKE